MKYYLHIIRKYNSINFTLFLMLCIFSKSSYSADGYVYAARSLSPSYGYNVDLSQRASISKNPTIASNGTYFYKVGQTFLIPENKKDGNGVTKVGTVKCDGGVVSINLPNAKTGSYKPFHRVFMYVPQAPFTINGMKTYQLSYNTFITVKVSLNMDYDWVQSSGPYCDKPTEKDRPMRDFYKHLPIEIDVYIKKKNIDGVTVIPSIDFAGYTRAFGNLKDINDTRRLLPGFMSIDQVTAPMRLIGGTIISSAECQTDVGGNLIINHGVLNAEKYESRVVRPINFSCDHVIPTPVEFELFYTKDGDPQQRLPLKVDGTNRTIYSKIQMIDAETGNRGQKFTSRVGQYKQIQIESILKGTNASGGNYSGTAVLIAAYP